MKMQKEAFIGMLILITVALGVFGWEASYVFADGSEIRTESLIQERSIYVFLAEHDSQLLQKLDEWFAEAQAEYPETACYIVIPDSSVLGEYLPLFLHNAIIDPSATVASSMQMKSIPALCAFAFGRKLAGTERRPSYGSLISAVRYVQQIPHPPSPEQLIGEEFISFHYTHVGGESEILGERLFPFLAIFVNNACGPCTDRLNINAEMWPSEVRLLFLLVETSNSGTSTGTLLDLSKFSAEFEVIQSGIALVGIEVVMLYHIASSPAAVFFNEKGVIAWVIDYISAETDIAAMVSQSL